MEVYIKQFDELRPAELYAILKLRPEVFMLEQRCRYPELDGCDAGALHVWLADGSGIAAYLRILDRGVRSAYVTIGRVVSARRGLGLGERVMREGIRAAREILGADAIYLEAQAYAQGFYEKLGFRRISEPFDEDGIPHVQMLLNAAEEKCDDFGKKCSK